MLFTNRTNEGSGAELSNRMKAIREPPWPRGVSPLFRQGEDLLDRCAKYGGESQREHRRGNVVSPFDRVDRLAGNTDCLCKLCLGETGLSTQQTEAVVEFGSRRTFDSSCHMQSEPARHRARVAAPTPTMTAATAFPGSSSEPGAATIKTATTNITRQALTALFMESST